MQCTPRRDAWSPPRGVLCFRTFMGTPARNPDGAGVPRQRTGIVEDGLLQRHGNDQLRFFLRCPRRIRRIQLDVEYVSKVGISLKWAVESGVVSLVRFDLFRWVVAMAYEAPIDRPNLTCILCLVDQSGSMNDLIGGEATQ